MKKYVTIPKKYGLRVDVQSIRVNMWWIYTSEKVAGLGLGLGGQTVKRKGLKNKQRRLTDEWSAVAHLHGGQK